MYNDTIMPFSEPCHHNITYPNASSWPHMKCAIVLVRILCVRVKCLWTFLVNLDLRQKQVTQIANSRTCALHAHCTMCIVLNNSSYYGCNGNRWMDANEWIYIYIHIHSDSTMHMYKNTPIHTCIHLHAI